MGCYSNSLPPLTQDQVDAMDDTFDTSLDVRIPAAQGGDLRSLAVLPAWVIDGLARGTLSIDDDAEDH